ncbi:hypothetical protein AB0D27_04075 [Streptomyces sp. NPDC048415]|uniref:hypothetical protein n=1 Tax=Streptomyces sp. NPDC048415 TaxID=3154822 RepID=UPI00343DFD20
MVTPTEGSYVRCTTKRVLRGAGVGVLVLSLALTGCQGKKHKKKSRGLSSTSRSRTTGGSTSGTSLTGAQAAKSVLPSAEDMPSALRTVADTPYTSARGPKSCKDPAARCKNAVARGDVGYSTSDRGEGARFEVIVYRNASAASKAFRAWKTYAQDNSKLQVLDTQASGSHSMTFHYRTSSLEASQETVILRGKYIGTLTHRDQDNVSLTTASATLTGLDRMYAERLRQLAADETPTASAAALKVS